MEGPHSAIGSRPPEPQPLAWAGVRRVVVTLEPHELEALRPFWYPVLPLEQLGDGPVGLDLLGQRLVLWRTAAAGGDGAVAVAEDRCAHRSARLSGGRVTEAGCLVCPYHGWEFDADGSCRKVPQEPARPIPARFRIRAHRARVRYGYVWVCLAPEARHPIPVFAEAEDPAVRLIHGFFETWRCSPFRVIENGLDNYHHHFVHRGLLEATSPIPAPLRDGIEPTEDGFRFSLPLEVANNGTLSATLDDHSQRLTVERRVRWIAPLGLSLELGWPNGLRQRIVLFAVPQDGRDSRIVRFYFRNDREEQVPEANVTRFERGLIDQDRRILEGIVGAYGAAPVHENLIEADQPIALMRQRLRQLLDGTGAAVAGPSH
ncbi:MAG: aromatic ring-hydroxylating dioxygenase subunit alpha [Cyanobacteria bacterium K_Offshore_surface_m2_011]|nr:aromatic ring-hydroxylating dioxygenase subunit alpha [Cyanobacteria bacterium K_Offshore_surface_m2_011]